MYTYRYIHRYTYLRCSWSVIECSIIVCIWSIQQTKSNVQLHRRLTVHSSKISLKQCCKNRIRFLLTSNNTDDFLAKQIPMSNNNWRLVYSSKFLSTTMVSESHSAWSLKTITFLTSDVYSVHAGYDPSIQRANFNVKLYRQLVHPSNF